METRPGWWGDIGVLLCVKTGSTNSWGVWWAGMWGQPMFRCVLSKMKSGKSVFWGSHLFVFFFFFLGGGRFLSGFCRSREVRVCVLLYTLYSFPSVCLPPPPPRVVSPFSLTNSASLPPSAALIIYSRCLKTAIAAAAAVSLSLSLSLSQVCYTLLCSSCSSTTARGFVAFGQSSNWWNFKTSFARPARFLPLTVYLVQ